VRKNYQSRQVGASAAADAVVVPDEVTIALGEIAESVKEDCWRWPWARGCRCWPR
jgi:hypothetical protein